jgi:hypothetical protein
MNYLANSKPLGGISTGEISAKYNTLFTPSGFTFSIWGIIYLLVFAFVIVFVTSKSGALPNMNLLGILFIVSCVLNISWLLCWHFDKIFLSSLVMILFLGTLLSMLEFTSPEGITYITFSIYSGWISVALIANISILLFKYKIKLFMNREKIWLYIILAISLLIGGYMVIYEKNYYYGIVFIWAYFGIAMRYAK